MIRDPLGHLKKLLEMPEFHKDFEAWKTHPVTVQLLEVASAMSRPALLHKPDGNSALYQGGIHVGYDRLLQFLRDPEGFVLSLEQEQVPESYGVAEMMAGLPRPLKVPPKDQ